MNIDNWISRVELIKEYATYKLDPEDNVVNVDAVSFEDLIELIEEILDVINK